MRFKNFLMEAEDTFTHYNRPVNPNKGKNVKQRKAIVNLLTTDYSVAYQKFKEGKGIWRGIRDYFDARLFPAANRQVRRSANTNNYYTLLIDNALPAWKNFPKRGTGLICSNDEELARDYGRGHLYAVLPKNGSRIGITPGADMWFSFAGRRSYTLAKLNQDVANLFKKFDITLSESDPNMLVAQLKKLDVYQTIEQVLKTKPVDYRYYEDMLSQCKNTFKFPGGNFYELYAHVLNPKGFISTTIEQYNLANDGNEHEVWTDGDCLIINSEYIDELRHSI